MHIPPFAAVLLSITLAGPAFAEDKPAYPSALLNEIRPGNELPDLLADTPRLLERFDRDGNGLNAADITFAEQTLQAQFRANAAGRMLHMDLNADNKVTKDEVRMTSSQNGPDTPALFESRLRNIMRDDANGDGVLTLDEALSSGINHGCRRPVNDMGAQLLALDLNKDGTLTQAELDKVATGIFKSFDANNDGVISSKEYEAARPAFRTNVNEPPSNPDCLMR